MIAAGSKVILYLGEEPEAEEVVVPNISGLSYPEAVRRLGSSGLYARKASGVSGAGAVVGTQYTEAGAKVPYGSVVEVALIEASGQGEY